MRSSLILCPFGLESASRFIFELRKTSEGIVFVLYIDLPESERQRVEFYRGVRKRFSHFYKLDKSTPISLFPGEVKAAVSKCRFYLKVSLPANAVEALRLEAERLVLKEASAEGNTKLLEQFRGLVDRMSSVLSQTTQAAQVFPSRKGRPNTVFLSYRFAEQEYVKGLSELLTENGFEIVTGAAANTYISQAILQRIEDCEYFVCLMTRAAPKADGTYATSPWLLEEKGAALAYGKPIVLMIESGVTDVGGLQGDWQRIEFGEKGFINAALQAVKQLKSYAGTFNTPTTK